MTLKLKIGKKGYVILPKAIRESVGIEEGDEVTVDVSDGITLRPERKSDPERLQKAFQRHSELLKTVKGARSPKPGELASISFEDEFEQ